MYSSFSFRSKCLCSLAVLFIAELFYYALANHKSKTRKKAIQKPVNDVIFFRETGITCKSHVMYSMSCGEKYCSYSQLKRFISYIESASKKLDICIYMLTIQEIADTIVKLHCKGVNIRIICEVGMADGSGTKIGYLRRLGIPVRMKKSPYLMHHKFFIVDSQILATGSFNWTLQAITGNWDNVIITSEKSIVEPFINEFEYIWENFSR